MASNDRAYAVMMATAADRGEAERLARLLVEGRMAACVQLLPIESFYLWRERLERGAEILLLVKTRRELVEPAMAALKAAHAYETPEIIALPIDNGLPDYLAWIDGVTGSLGGD
ncbi:MAG: divalent-cation tolerance protein CutA [Caulobacteraceae bacterium]|nr:divalent-cation tolerance protein CutA [Caulobacteraceae bacterium]